MKLEPVRDEILGVALLHSRQEGSILLPHITKNVTRCYLIEEVGPEAEAANYKRGDIVIARKVYDILLYGGSFHRVTFQLTDIIYRVRSAGIEEFTTLDNKPVIESLNGSPELVGAVLAVGKNERAA